MKKWTAIVKGRITIVMRIKQTENWYSLKICNSTEKDYVHKKISLTHRWRLQNNLLLLAIGWYQPTSQRRNPPADVLTTDQRTGVQTYHFPFKTPIPLNKQKIDLHTYEVQKYIHLKNMLKKHKDLNDDTQVCGEFVTAASIRLGVLRNFNLERN